MTGRVPPGAWATIVRHAPIVSVDLVVPVGDGVLLGRRRNEPAASEWFVPGGRLLKGERLDEAARRVAREELGVDVRLVRRLGVYEHRYDEAEVPDAGGKHYVPVGYVVEPLADAFEPDGQHDRLCVFDPPFDGAELHPHVLAYLRDAGFEVEG